MSNQVILIKSDRAGISGRIPKIGRTLKRNGYDIQILTWDKTGDYPADETIDGVPAHNFQLNLSNTRKYTKFFYFATWWVYIIWYILRERPDIVHALDLKNTLPVIILKPFIDVTVVYDIGDSAAFTSNRSTIYRRLLEAFETFAIRGSDGIIHVDEARKSLVNVSSKTHSAVILNSVEDFYPDFLENNNSSENEKYTIYYGGWITETRGINILLDLLEDIDDVRLIVAGPKPNKRELMLRIKQRHDVEYKGTVPHLTSLRYTFDADAVWAYYDPKIPINELASPNKVFEAMMCATPIIANLEAKPVRQIVESEKCGVLAPYDDVDGVKNSIQYLKDNPESSRKLGHNGRKGYTEKYNWDKMENRIVEFYQKLL